jgi:hypothetical protein
MWILVAGLCSQDSDYTADWTTLEIDKRGLYSPQRPHRLFGPTNLLYDVYCGLFPEVTQPGREAEYSLRSRAEVKNLWSYTSTAVNFYTWIISMCSMIYFTTVRPCWQSVNLNSCDLCNIHLRAAKSDFRKYVHFIKVRVSSLVRIRTTSRVKITLFLQTRNEIALGDFVNFYLFASVITFLPLSSVNAISTTSNYSRTLMRVFLSL